MADYLMEVIPEPSKGTRAVLRLGPDAKAVFFKGEGGDNYLCGTCQTVICEKIDRGQLANLVFLCPNCGCYNELKGT